MHGARNGSGRRVDGGLDLIDDPLRSCVTAAHTVDGAAEVVDDHLRTAAGQLKGVCAPKAATRAGDDRCPTVEGDFRHTALRLG